MQMAQISMLWGEEFGETLAPGGVSGVVEGDAVGETDQHTGVIEVARVGRQGEGGLDGGGSEVHGLAGVEEARGGLRYAAFAVDAHGIVGPYEEQGAGFVKAADGFHVGVVFVGVGGDEDVDVEVFGLDEDGELAVEAEREAGDGGAAVGEVEVDADEGSGGIFEDKTVLAEEPEGDGVWRYLEGADGAHVVRAGDEARHDELYGGGAIVGVVAGKDVVCLPVG